MSISLYHRHGSQLEPISTPLTDGAITAADAREIASGLVEPVEQKTEALAGMVSQLSQKQAADLAALQNVDAGLGKDIAASAKAAGDHAASRDNPHNVTKAQVGLGNIPNAISSAVDSAREDQLATSKAVKTAWDKGAEAKTAADAAKTAAGNAQKSADGKLDRTGGELTGPVRFKTDLPVAAEDISELRTSVAVESLAPGGAVIGRLAAGVWPAESSNFKEPSLSYGVNAFGKSPSGKNISTYITCLLGLETGKAAACAPTAPDSYNNFVVNTRVLKDYAPEKLTANATIHVGGANASDTADLHNGRGLSAEMPFATLSAAVIWGCAHKIGVFYPITIELHSDVTLSTVWINAANIKNLCIKSNGYKIILSQRFNVVGGLVEFIDAAKLVRNGSSDYLVYCSGRYGCGSAAINFCSTLEINGTVSVGAVFAGYGGWINLEGSITGAVVGKRYLCVNGGRIFTGGKGINAIPGTEAGTCDASSVYA